MNTYKYIATILLSLTFVSGFSQTELSLMDAISISLEKNYDIRIESKRVEIAENNNNWGQAGRYPSVDLSVGQNNSRTNNIETASPFQLQGTTISSNVSPGINATWVLFDGFRINIEKTRLEELQAESNGNAEIVIANTIQAVILGYYSAVLENEKRREFSRQLTLSKDKYEYTRVKSELGSSTTGDLLLEETNFLNDSTNYINQSLLYRNAIRNLNFILGEKDPEREYVLTDELTVDLQDYTLEDLLVTMKSSNVDLKKQYITQGLSVINTELAKSERLPSLTFTPGYSYNVSRVDLSNAFRIGQDGSQIPVASEPLSARSDNIFANLRLSFTLFNGGRINRAIQNAMIQEDIASISTERITASLSRDLSRSLDQYDVRKNILSINDRKLSVSTQNLALASEKFRSGTINSFDYRIVQNNQLSAAIQRLSSLYSVIDSQVTLLRLTGGLIQEYGRSPSDSE